MAGWSLLNSSAVRELGSLVLKENIVQNIMVIPGRSADFRYTEDMGAKIVTVNRPKIVNGGREVGASTNGGFFNTNTGSAESALYDIPLTYVFDKPIKISQVQDDMAGGTALRGQLENVPKAIARFVNSTYFASLIAANVNKGIKEASAEGTVSYSLDTDYITEISADTTAGAVAGINTAMSKFNEGDSDNGFDIFPFEQSTIYCSGTMVGYLAGQTNFIVNNPIGQQMLASGSFDALNATYTPDTINGYIGQYLGALLYRVGSLFKTAVGYLGLETISDSSVAATTSTALDKLLAIVVCGLAVGGGLNPGDIKVVDARGGQGWEIQPLARCGFSIFSPKGVHTIWALNGVTETNFVAATGAGAVATRTKRTKVYQPENR